MEYYGIMIALSSFPIVKAWSSCVRSEATRCLHEPLIEHVQDPTAGLLVVVRSLSDNGVYNQLEDPTGRYVELYEGDLFVGVLGARCSGTNLVAELPSGPLAKGDILQLASVAGLVAHVVNAPGTLGLPPMAVAVEGFVRAADGNPAHIGPNISDEHTPLSLLPPKRVIVVSGSSAESGKTTLVCNLLRAMSSEYPHLRCSALKASGTGRLRDSLRHWDAGAAWIGDFVDVGLPTTYGVELLKYVQALTSLLWEASHHSDCIIVELGGDLIEASVPIALTELAVHNPLTFFCVNDALAATEGMRLIRKAGHKNVIIATRRQNTEALSRRLGVNVLFNNDRSALLNATLKIWN